MRDRGEPPLDMVMVGINTLLYTLGTLARSRGIRKKNNGALWYCTVVTFIVYWCGTSSARQRRMSHRCPITLTICFVNMAIVSCSILNGRVGRLCQVGRYLCGGKLRVSLPRVPIRP